MNNQSTYYLIAQIIEEKKKYLWKNGDSGCDTSDFQFLLTKKAGVNYEDDIKGWVDWFLCQDSFSEKEKKSLKMLFRIFNIERKSKEKMINNKLL